MANLQVLAWVNKDVYSKVDEPIDESNIPSDSGRMMPSDRGIMSTEKEDELIQKGKNDKETRVDVSVSIWYTKEFAAMEEDVQGYINTCFAEANGALTNSRVPMRLKHHGTWLYEGEEMKTGQKMLNAFAWGRNTDAVLKSADASILLCSDHAATDVCGVAWFNSPRYPFGLARHQCAR